MGLWGAPGAAPSCDATESSWLLGRSRLSPERRSNGSEQPQIWGVLLGLSLSHRGKRLIIIFLGICGSFLSGSGEEAGLPWRLLGWGGSWKLSRVAVGFWGLKI